MNKKSIKKEVEKELPKPEPVEEPVSIPITMQQEPPKPTHKQVLETLRDEMTRLGIHSIGQLEVLISQQK